MTSSSGPHLSSESSARIEYPSDIWQLPERRAQVLFELSSMLPEEFSAAARDVARSLDRKVYQEAVNTPNSMTLWPEEPIGTRAC